MLMTAPVMAYPTDKDEYILDADASDLAIGGTLIQVQNGIEKTIAYGSRTLNKAERRYCVTRRELMAIVNFIQHYKHYLLGRKFKVRSYHHALKWIFRLKDPSGQVARWLGLNIKMLIDYQEHLGKIHYVNAFQKMTLIYPVVPPRNVPNIMKL